jgi:hypothetical protein
VDQIFGSDIPNDILRLTSTAKLAEGSLRLQAAAAANDGHSMIAAQLEAEEDKSAGPSSGYCFGGLPSSAFFAATVEAEEAKRAKTGPKRTLCYKGQICSC